MHLELRSDDDNGTSGVVYTLTEEVLSETALLTLEHVRQGLELSVARSRCGTLNRCTVTAIVDQCVNSFLEHSLLVPYDDLRCAEIEELLKTVVSSDNSSVEIVKI